MCLNTADMISEPAPCEQREADGGFPCINPIQQDPFLLPVPKGLTLKSGYFSLAGGGLIMLDSPRPQGLLKSSNRLQAVLGAASGKAWELNAARGTPPALGGLTLRHNPQLAPYEQAYSLSIDSSGITVEGRDEAGIFYGVCTLIQLIEQYGASIRCLEILDWPDFPVRGVMIDISRDKVPTIETLYKLVDMLAGWKVNQLQLYTEHTFAYQRHPEVWATASPMTGQDILRLDAYCRERYIELVPNQNSFGHLQRWLVHPRYAALAEVNEGYESPAGKVVGPYSLCPTDPASLDFVFGLYDELLPHFTSKMFNAGCDETFDLGQGRSMPVCSLRGPGMVYLDYLIQIYKNLKQRGLTMQFWGDMVAQYPGIIPHLPRDLIALEWGYEADHPYEENAARLAEAGIPFYVCPGTSSWSSLAGRSTNALKNLLNAAETGLRYGAVGYLVTDWGDNGHWQFLPVSYLGFAAGAAYAWGLEANRTLDIVEALNRYAFQDRVGVMGKVAYELGNIYKSLGIEWLHSSALSSILQRSLKEVGLHPKLRSIPYQQVMERIDQAVANFDLADIQRPDARLIQCEYALTARLLRHACKRGMLAKEFIDGVELSEIRRQAAWLKDDLGGIMASYRSLWLERNRPGGLLDSLARFEKSGEDYNLIAP